MQTQEPTFRQTIDQVRAMMKPDFDWSAYDEQDYPDDLFRQCILVETISSREEAKKYISAGSAEVLDTPAALYRMLYLTKPKQVDFSNMYKTSLISFFSADKRFLVDVGFYKYKLNLRFYALRDLVDTSEASGVYCGVPGVDNGYHIKDEDGVAFFDMVKEATAYEWDVYPGNNFTV